MLGSRRIRKRDATTLPDTAQNVEQPLPSVIPSWPTSARDFPSVSTTASASPGDYQQSPALIKSEGTPNAIHHAWSNTPPSQSAMAEAHELRPRQPWSISAVTVSMAETLLVNLGLASDSVAALRPIVDNCLELYSVYIYPITPLVDVFQLRADAERLYDQLDRVLGQRGEPSGAHTSTRHDYSHRERAIKPTTLDMTFSLMTALCSYVALVLSLIHI